MTTTTRLLELALTTSLVASLTLGAACSSASRGNATLSPDVDGADAAPPRPPVDEDGGTPTDDAGQGPDDAGASLSIATVRNPAAPGHVPFGGTVTVSGGVVTFVKTAGASHGFFIQDPKANEWAGIYVFVGTGTATVAKGDVVTVTGAYTSYRGFEEIQVGAVPPVRTGSASIPPALVVPLADIAPGGSRTKELQSMLLRVVDVEAATTTMGVEFLAQPAGGGGAQLAISSYMAADVGPSPFPATMGQSFSSITGFGYYGGPTDATAYPKLAPASAADVQ